MTVDQKTMAAYAEKARDYAARFGQIEPGTHLKAFMAILPPKARVLDLGCGPGNASSAMLGAGHTVEAWDASPEMAAMAREKFGIDVRVATFDALDADEVYDGIYANFSLLHLPKPELPGILNRIANALRPGGTLHLGMKSGTGERRDKLGRFYAYYTEAELKGLLTDAGFTITKLTTGEEAGLDGTVSPWIILQAQT